MKTSLSIIVPLFNEARNVPILIERLFVVLDGIDPASEILLVDDGSRDRTFDAVKQEAVKNNRVRGIKFRRNFGQTAAIKAGVEHARGDICITIDGDLQHDPEHIPHFLQRMEEGFFKITGHLGEINRIG